MTAVKVQGGAGCNFLQQEVDKSRIKYGYLTDWAFNCPTSQFLQHCHVTGFPEFLPRKGAADTGSVGCFRERVAHHGL